MSKTANTYNKYIYLISTPKKAKKNIFKVEKHKGTKKGLLSRYTTALLSAKIFYVKSKQLLTH